MIHAAKRRSSPQSRRSKLAFVTVLLIVVALLWFGRQVVVFSSPRSRIFSSLTTIIHDSATPRDTTPASSMTAQRNMTSRLSENVYRGTFAPPIPSAPPPPRHWKARDRYLPLNPAAKKSFQQREEKYRLLLGGDRPPLRGTVDSARCLADVPECEFFYEMKKETPLLFAKCCDEHTKLKKLLFYVADVAEQFDLRIFLMFGTLLSSMRDDGGSLVPWETDIDLGILGADPFVMQRAFESAAAEKGRQSKNNQSAVSSLDKDYGERFVFEACKTSGNDVDPMRRGSCSDVHTVAYEHLRLELWPYRMITVTKSKLRERNKRQLGAKHEGLMQLYDDLLIPLSPPAASGASSRPSDVDSIEAFETVRKSELVLPMRMVLPLTISPPRSNRSSNTTHAAYSCTLWGRQFRCPHQSEMFLDLEYHGRQQWMVPKTIHWGSENVLPWKGWQ